MSKWENEDVSNLELPDPETTVTDFFDAKGNNCNENFAVAKTVTTNHEDGRVSTNFYIRCTRGEFVDPHDTDRHIKLYELGFTKVTMKTFTQYARYLATKNRLYFTRARRLNMEN